MSHGLLIREEGSFIEEEKLMRIPKKKKKGFYKYKSNRAIR